MQKLIGTIKTYREGKSWFFDDKSRKIKHEQFVSGVPEIIVALSGKPDTSLAKMHFSVYPFKGFTHVLKKFSEDPNPRTGVTYEVSNKGETLRGWFCPCFWKFFLQAPIILYVQVVPIMWDSKVKS